MARLFLGLEIPHDVKSHISDYLKPMHQSPKGWEHPSDYHQTLLFIGETNEENLNIIKERMLLIDYHPFTLKLSEFKFFNRRIMYLGMGPSISLMELKIQIDELFSPWVNPLEKPFIPHITVKRWQRYEFDHLDQGLKSSVFGEISFPVNTISLFESKKDSENRKYHVIYRVELI